MEPCPFSPSLFSHNINRAGLRYEIGLYVRNTNLVWASGPYARGAYSDVRIFRCGLKKLLQTQEFVIGGRGYTVRCVRPPHNSNSLHRPLALVRARYEAFNSCLTLFKTIHIDFSLF